MRHNINHAPLALALTTYSILLLSSFIPLNAIMSVSSSIHITTAHPIATISLTQPNATIISERFFDNSFLPGEEAQVYYRNGSAIAGSLSYTLHNNKRPMALAASSTENYVSVELVSINNPQIHKKIQLSKEPTLLFTNLNNSYDTYLITYYAHDINENLTNISIEYSLTSQ